MFGVGRFRLVIEGSRSLPRRMRVPSQRVNHPNICQLYELGEHEGELFLAMELLQGEALASRLTRGPMPPAEAVTVALGMLGGLGALHRESIVHRDLKPSNIFLAPPPCDRQLHQRRGGPGPRHRVPV